MAKIKVQDKLPGRVASVLEKDLKAAGFSVEAIETEPIKGTKLFRVTLIAKGFEKIWVTERQDIVWRILQESFTKAERLRISMVVTLAPSEAVLV
jgi:hypothetical protein